MSAVRYDCTVTGSEMDEGGGGGRGRGRGGKGKQVGNENETTIKKRKANTLGVSSSSEMSGEESEVPKVTQEERDSEENKVVINFQEEGGIGGVNPIRLTSALKNAIGDIVAARVTRNGSLVVTCKNMDQRERVLKLEKVGQFQVESVVKNQPGKIWNKGVITGIPVCVKMEEIKNNIRGGNIVSAQRLQVTRDGIKEDSLSVLLQFEGGVLPGKVTIGYMSYPVRLYVPKPLRCYNCQRFGHVAIMCNETRRCARCGGNHNYGQCGENVPPKCCNCGGEHSVAYGGCTVMKEAVQVQQVRVEQKVSYSEAVKKVRNQTAGSSSEDNVRFETKQVRLNEGNMIQVDIRKLVTFIAGVINGTADVKSKTERIQLIVMAAVRHLDVTGLTWETVRDDLKHQSSQETWVG